MVYGHYLYVRPEDVLKARRIDLEVVEIIGVSQSQLRRIICTVAQWSFQMATRTLL